MADISKILTFMEGVVYLEPCFMCEIFILVLIIRTRATGRLAGWQADFQFG
jgi:hypothetical protein